MANLGPFVDPVAVSRDTVQNIGVQSPDMRFALGGLSAPSSGATFGNQTGVFPGGSAGAGVANDGQVSAAGGMATRSNACAYACDRGASGLYLGAQTGSTGKTHLQSNPSNPRYDWVVIRNRDPGVDSGVTESAFYQILDGTPSSSPQYPNAKLTSGDVPLAVVLIRAGATTIADADIIDGRRFVVGRGGITPAAPGDDRPGSYEGQYRDNIAYKQLERWSGTVWEAMASPAAWRSFTPRLYAQGSKTDVSLGGSGAVLACRYQLVGKRLDFAYAFKWGAPPFNGGVGDVCTYLPRHPVTGDQLYGASYDQWVQSHLWCNNSAFVGDFFGQALILANNSRVQPFFSKVHAHQPPANPIDMNTLPYRIAGTAAKAASGVPRIFNPDGFPEGGSLHLTGSCEVTW